MTSALWVGFDDDVGAVSAGGFAAGGEGRLPAGFRDGFCGAVAVDVGSVASFRGCRYLGEVTSVETGILGAWSLS